MSKPIVGIFNSKQEAESAASEIEMRGSVAGQSRTCSNPYVRFYDHHQLDESSLSPMAIIQLLCLALFVVAIGVLVTQQMVTEPPPLFVAMMSGGTILFLVFAAVMLRRTSQPDVTDLLNARLKSQETAVIVDFNRLGSKQSQIQPHTVQTIMVQHGGHCIEPDENED
ncbi:MAG TPA: hypothetical protein DD473_21685 [Planctomycetaceae bacterium]|nr:hypothetical protein [Planctomycetaceae bacterium]